MKITEDKLGVGAYLYRLYLCILYFCPFCGHILNIYYEPENGQKFLNTVFTVLIISDSFQYVKRDVENYCGEKKSCKGSKGNGKWREKGGKGGI